ncbi:tetratricopeptide repeat protein [Rhodopila sp.]|uniref:tetratricopeptide repeat protein n=1 Tax=Rhodopila sp. TaxID=2480087 RepID=UPI003D122904
MDMTPVTADAGALRNRVAQLIDAGRTGAARPLLAAARTLSPDGCPDIALLMARLDWRDGNLDRAMRTLTDAIIASPAHAGLRKSRSELSRTQGDLDGAARDAAEAVILDRVDPAAKALLGNALLELGRTGDAIACLTDAVAAAPSAATYREALATALEKAGQTEAALRLLREGMAISPANVALNNAATLLCMRRRDFDGAVRMAEQARLLGIADACTFGMKGHALASLGNHEEAAIAYQDALKLGPEDPYVRHLVMAAGAMPSGKRAPEEYIKAVFDGYADRFEAHLISLSYTVPVRIRLALEAHPVIAAGHPLGPVLDLGCGTGLVALAASDLPLGPITGVDLSPRMLDQARAKGLYADLREADIMAELTADSPQQWPLIIAADVLVYFGALEDVFAAVHARLKPGGWFVFSIEDLLADHAGVVPGNGSWALHRLGRYAHSADYIFETACAAGFRMVRMDRQPMRQEAGQGVPGMLIVVERLRHDG